VGSVNSCGVLRIWFRATVWNGGAGPLYRPDTRLHAWLAVTAGPPDHSGLPQNSPTCGLWSQLFLEVPLEPQSTLPFSDMEVASTQGFVHLCTTALWPTSKVLQILHMTGLLIRSRLQGEGIGYRVRV